jgi:hypothetical protein
MHISSIPIPQTQVIVMHIMPCRAMFNLKTKNQPLFCVVDSNLRSYAQEVDVKTTVPCRLGLTINGLTFATMRAVRFLAPPKYFHNIDPNSFFRFC